MKNINKIVLFIFVCMVPEILIQASAPSLQQQLDDAAKQVTKVKKETKAKLQQLEQYTKMVDFKFKFMKFSDDLSAAQRSKEQEIVNYVVIYMNSIGENAIANRIGEAVRDAFMTGGTDEQIRATLISKIDDLNTQELLDKTDYDDVRIDELIAAAKKSR
jgi:hypothetical protein